MKTKNEKQILEVIENYSQNATIQNSALKVNDMTYLNAELVRKSIFSICSKALESPIGLSDEERMDMVELLNFGSKILFTDEAELLDEIQKFSKKKPNKLSTGLPKPYNTPSLYTDEQLFKLVPDSEAVDPSASKTEILQEHQR